MINSKSRARAIRVLLSAFLSSDLTTNEIRQLIKDIQEDSSLLWDVREIVETLLERIEEGPSRRRVYYDHREQPRSTDPIYNSIQRARLSKPDVWQAIKI